VKYFRILQNSNNGKPPSKRVMTKLTRQSLKYYKMDSLVPLARKDSNNRSKGQVAKRRGIYWLASSPELNI